ncbi:chaplin [Kitasatospora sp. NPDC127111]|uniref:chaplin n=1 Tax=Kitasatospora sp. NPDC127111 TaxID=3345363 RepID=UPI003644F2F8
MTNTRKYLIAAGLSAALAVIAAGPALAADCGSSASSAHSAPAAFVAAPGDAALLADGAGTVCINTGNAYASGIVTGSPGVLSGNQIQIPINAQINICGNSISLLG